MCMYNWCIKLSMNMADEIYTKMIYRNAVTALLIRSVIDPRLLIAPQVIVPKMFSDLPDHRTNVYSLIWYMRYVHPISSPCIFLCRLCCVTSQYLSIIINHNESCAHPQHSMTVVKMHISGFILLKIGFYNPYSKAWLLFTCFRCFEDLSDMAEYVNIKSTRQGWQ